VETVLAMVAADTLVSALHLAGSWSAPGSLAVAAACALEALMAAVLVRRADRMLRVRRRLG
jgi:hypothetical protein